MRKPPVALKRDALPAIATNEPWDGKDGQVITPHVIKIFTVLQLPVEEDDYDLSDVELDEEPQKEEL